MSIVTPLIVEGKPYGASPSLGTGTAISFASSTTTSTAREMASIEAENVQLQHENAAKDKAIADLKVRMDTIEHRFQEQKNQ